MFLFLYVLVEEKWDTTWTVGRSIFKERALVFWQDVPGAAPQDTQLQVDVYVDRGLTFWVITREEVVDVDLCMGSIHPSAGGDRVDTILKLLSIVDKRTSRKHVDGKGPGSSRAKHKSTSY